MGSSLLQKLRQWCASVVYLWGNQSMCSWLRKHRGKKVTRIKNTLFASRVKQCCAVEINYPTKNWNKNRLKGTTRRNATNICTYIISVVKWKRLLTIIYILVIIFIMVARAWALWTCRDFFSVYLVPSSIFDCWATWGIPYHTNSGSSRRVSGPKNYAHSVEFVSQYELHAPSLQHALHECID